MRIVTWNVNSIRRREEIVTAWLEANPCDVLLLQETKVTDDLFPRAAFEQAGWQLAIHGQKSLNGVAIVSRRPVSDVTTGLGDDALDDEARYIEASIEGVRVGSLYLPNGTSVGSDRFAFKLRFFKALHAHIAALREVDASFVIGGDYNVAPAEIDVYDPQDCEGDICFHEDERAGWRALVHTGAYDAFRVLHPTRRQYSWWDLRGGAFERDLGMRIDHLLVSPDIADRLSDAGADPKTRAGTGVSDHVPVWCTFA